MELIGVSFGQKMILRHLMELYQYDMSEFEEDGEDDVNEFGLFDYKYLDHYWTDDGRYPFFIRQSGKLAGFVLVREMAEGEETKYAIAEFFVLRKYRRHGLGKKAAFAVFERFKGRWSVSCLEKNASAKAFWTKVIRECAKGSYTETALAGMPTIEFST